MPKHISFTDPEALLGLDEGAVQITVTRSSGSDSAIVIFVDTNFEPDGNDGGPALRVLLNDDPIYVGVEHEVVGPGRSATAHVHTHTISDLTYEGAL